MKILTDELILQKLEDKKIKHLNDIDFEDVMEIVQREFNCTFTSDFDKWDKAVHRFYTESTRDGYEVYISNPAHTNVNINESVYYYDSDWYEDLVDVVLDCYDNDIIFFDDPDFDTNYTFMGLVEELYEKYWNDEKQIVEDELIELGYEPKDE